MADKLSIAGTDIGAGRRLTVNIPVARLYTHTEMTMPVHVLRGKKDGPHLFVSAAVHGDEIIGVEIIRRLLKLKILRRIRGSLIAVPVVNVYGFINQTRYLPDRAASVSSKWAELADQPWISTRGRPAPSLR